MQRPWLSGGPFAPRGARKLRGPHCIVPSSREIGGTVYLDRLTFDDFINGAIGDVGLFNFGNR